MKELLTQLEFSIFRKILSLEKLLYSMIMFGSEKFKEKKCKGKKS